MGEDSGKVAKTPDIREASPEKELMLGARTVEWEK